MSAVTDYVLPPDMLEQSVGDAVGGNATKAAHSDFILPPDMVTDALPKVFDLVGTASPFAINGHRARSVAEEAAVNSVSYDAADRDLDYMRTTASHERTIPAVQQQAFCIDKYLPRTQKLMANHGPALVAAGWNDMQNVTGFERIFMESGLAYEMGQLGMEQQRLNLKRFYGADEAVDKAQLFDIERRIAKYGEYRKDEGFFTGALRGMFQTFVPQAMAGGEKGITRGLQAGAAAGIASAAFGPAAIPTAGTAFGVGATTGVAEYAFEQSLADIYGSLADMKDAYGKPLDQGAARALAVVGGAGMAALEMVGLKYAVALMPSLSRVLSGTAVQSAMQAVDGSPAIAKAVGESGVRLLKSLAVEVGTEAAQEGVIIGAESAATSLARSQGKKVEHIRADDAIDRIQEAGTEAAKAFFFPSLAGASLGGLGAYRAAKRKAQHAQVERENISSIAKAVQQSSLVAESPTVAQNAIRFATDGKPLYIAPQSLSELFQTTQGQEVARSMGITAGQVADAIDLGIDVAVPIHKQTSLMRSEFWENIEPYTRLTPNGVTQEQSVALKEGQADITQESIDDFMSMLTEVDQDAQRKDNWRQWTEGYRFEMQEAGYTKLQADSFGDVLASHAEVFAPMFGQDPQGYLKQRLVRIEQATPATYENTKTRFLQGLEFNMHEERLQAEQEKVHITQKSPLMATIWGQASPESAKAMAGNDTYRELVKRYGRGMFAKRSKGVAWDVAVQSAIRQGLLPETANPSDVADALAGSKVLYQPVNIDVDIDKAMPVVHAEIESSPVWKSMKVDKKAIIQGITGKMYNESTGIEVDLSAKNAEHMISSATSRGAGVAAHIAAVRNIRELVRVAERIESYSDKKGQNDVANIHRFYAPLGYDGNVYAVNMTVKEYHGERSIELNGVHKLYDVKLENKTPTGLADEQHFSKSPVRPVSVSEITIRQLLDGVNDKAGNAFFAKNSSDVSDPQDARILYQDGDASLRRDAVAWGVQVDGIATSGKVPSSPVQMLAQTPLVMQMLGAKERPVYAAPHLFDGTHPNITADMLKGLPQALADPIAIFQSKTHKDRLVFMLEMTDASGATVVLPVQLDGTKHHTTIHIATTVYAKNKMGLPDNEWFVKQAGNVLYMNKAKEKRWLMFSGSNSLWNAASVSSDKNIRTETDLVNIRAENPSMYAGGKKSPRGSITFRPQDNAAMISIFKGKGDISTLVHEVAGHLFLENLREAAQQQGAPEWVQQTWDTIARDIGADLDPASNVSVEAHEKFAATAVEYFRRGKAPSQELRSVFRMFGRWLASIYRGVRRMLDFRDISPEIDEAMGRLIATEADISKTDQTLDAPVDAPVGADVNKWTAYLKLAKAAQTDAQAAIALRRLDEEQRITKEARLEAKILMTSDKNMLDISRLKNMGGISLEDISDTFGEESAWTIKERWQGWGKKLIKKSGTLTIDDIMQELEFVEPQQALAWLLDAQTEQEFINAVVAERLAEWEASYSPESEAVATASADAALMMRDEALSGESQIGTASLLRELERRAQDMTLDALDGEYGALRAAERRRSAAKTLAGEVIGAERKRRAALGTAYRVRMEREKIKGQIRRIVNYKTALEPFHQQILSLVALYDGLGTKGMRPRNSVPSLQDFYTQWALTNGMDESQSPSVPSWMIDHMGPQSDMRLGDLTIEQLREIHSMIKQLHHMGRTAGALVGALHKADVDNSVAALTATMDRLPEKQHIDEIARQTLIGKTRVFLRNSYATKAIMRYVFKMADGYISRGDSLEMGPNERIIHRPLAAAATVELGLRKEYSRLLREALAPLASMRDIEKPFVINGVTLAEDVSKDWRNMWTMEKVFALALNMGNEGNRKSIMRGYGLTQEEVDIVLQRMTPELWQSVQKVWDALEGLYPRLNTVHEALYGVPLTKVTHTGFEVQHGDTVMQMGGGYYPLIFDRKFSKKAAENEDVDTALNSYEAIVRKPNPKSGFTKERQGGTLPPLLSMDVLSRHITDSIHYAAFTLPLRDAYVLTSNSRYEASFVRAFGQELHKEILPWLRGIARPEPKLKSQGDKIINWMASRGTLTTLGFSFRTAAMGFTSIPNSVNRVGLAPFVTAAAYCAVHPYKAWRLITESSNYMDNRATMMDRDMRAYLDSMFKRADFVNMGPLKISRKQFEKAAFAMIVAVDAVVAAPTWLAQHERALDAGKSMDEAVQAADDAVFEAQAGGSVVDMSALMRDPGMMRLLTVFMTFTSNQYNKTAYYWRGLKTRISAGVIASDIGFAEFSKYIALEIFASSTLIALLFSLGQEGEAPEAKDIAWEALGTLVGGNPLLRMLPSFMKYGTKPGETAGMRGIQSVGDVLRIGAGMASGELTTMQRRKKFMRSAINAAGFAAGVPTLQVWRSVDGIDAFSRGVGGPLTPIFGPPPKRKKGGLL